MRRYANTCKDGYQGRRFHRGRGHEGGCRHIQGAGCSGCQGDHPNNQVRRTGNVELVQSGSMKGVVVTSIGNMLLNSRKYWEQF